MSNTEKWLYMKINIDSYEPASYNMEIYSKENAIIKYNEQADDMNNSDYGYDLFEDINTNNVKYSHYMNDYGSEVILIARNVNEITKFEV